MSSILISRDYREERKKTVKPILFEELYKRIDTLYYDFYYTDEYLHRFDVDEGGYQDTHDRDIHCLFAVASLKNEKGKKAILIEYTSCYDYSQGPNEYLSFEEHTSFPDISIYSLKRFLSCVNHPICHRCKQFDLTISYSNRFSVAQHKKFYHADVLCNECDSNILFVFESKTPCFEKIPYHSMFSSSYNEFVLRDKYRSYFQENVMNDLISYSLSPERLEWILDHDTKERWNL